ncbi:PEGA domain-containing protein [Desulfurobacterium sp.]
MKLKILISTLSFPVIFFSCASSQPASQTTTLQDAEIQAIQSKSEKVFEELENEFQPEKSRASEKTPKTIRKEKPASFEEEIETVPQYKSGKIILKECAYGKNQRDARSTAIKRLSQDILSNVSTLEIAQKSLRKGKISREYFSQTVIGTRTILKGLRFQDLGRTKEGYKVCAIITEEGLKETIAYLRSTLKRDLSHLSKDELQKLQDQAFILLSLTESANDRNTFNFTMKKLKYIDKLLNFGRLNINVVPANATIVIGEKEYSPGEIIFLEPEKEYFVTIKSKGYKTIRKRIYIGRGEIKNISIELPKKVEGFIPVSIKTNMPFVTGIAKKALIDSGFNIKNQSENKLTITVKDYSSRVKGYTKHELEVTATFYADGQPIISKKGKIKPFFTTDETENSILKSKLEKLTKAVLNSLLNSIDTKRLGGGEK